MKLKIVSLLLLAITPIAYSMEKIPAKSGFPKDIPFKKSLTLTTVLLFDTPQEDEKLVKKLTEKLSNYTILQSQALEVTKPLAETRGALKRVITHTTFKNTQDLKDVITKVKQDTDKKTAGNLEELQRDRLIKFNDAAEAVSTSESYNPIKTAARQYFEQQKKLEAHPFFEKRDNARTELEPLMHEFLHKHYSDLAKLQQDFNEPIQKVNDYLNALK